MIEVKRIDLLFLQVDSIPEFLERKRGVDDNVLDAGHVETSSLLKGFRDECRYISFLEEVNDLLSGVLLLLRFLLIDAVLVYLLSKLSHGLFAVPNLSDER